MPSLAFSGSLPGLSRFRILAKTVDVALFLDFISEQNEVHVQGLGVFGAMIPMLEEGFEIRDGLDG